MPSSNEFKITILDDGRIKIESVGDFSPAIHASAEEFLKFTQELVGGKWEEKSKKGHHHHTHHHTHHHH